MTRPGPSSLKRYALDEPVDGVWTGFLPGARAGQLYGLRAHGPHAPREGHRFNAGKLLLDPYAREIVGEFRNLPEDHGYPSAIRTARSRWTSATTRRDRAEGACRRAARRLESARHVRRVMRRARWCSTRSM